MTCHDARESLSAFLDEALTPDERRPIEAHLEGCAECRRELERLRHTVALLHRVEPARAPVGFVDRVTTAARPRPWYRRVAAAAFLPLSVKVPAEVTALVMVALLAIYVFERTPALQQAAREETARPAPSVQLADKPGRPEPEGRRAVPERQRTVEISREAERPMERDSPPATPSAPAASSPPVAATPPAAKTEPPSESQVGSGARMEAASRKELLERPPDPVRAAPAPKLAAQPAQPSADVVARVAVKDRDAAERELAQLIARVGGSEAQRRRADAATTVEALIPQARYAEFAQGLTQIGTWQVESERPDLPTQVRVILRLAE
jgi:hypothetical protein